MSSVNSEVKKCDRCGVLYEVTCTNHDWRVWHLGAGYDMCESCYSKVVPILKPDTKLRSANRATIEWNEFVEHVNELKKKG